MFGVMGNDHDAFTLRIVWATCTYVSRDGEFNPDGRLINDVGNFQLLSDAVLYNAIAYALGGQSSNEFSQTSGSVPCIRVYHNFPHHYFFCSVFHQNMVPRRQHKDEPQSRLRSNAAGTGRPKGNAHWRAVSLRVGSV